MVQTKPGEAIPQNSSPHLSDGSYVSPKEILPYGKACDKYKKLGLSRQKLIPT